MKRGDPVFRADGLLKGLTYCAAPASRRRPAVLTYAVTINGKRTANSFSVQAIDFSEVYRRAVLAIAEARGIRSNGPLVDRMLATERAFLVASGLRLERVSYMQVVETGQARP